MRKMLFGVVAALAAVGLAAGAADAQPKKVRVATEGAYAPWNFTDASGKLVGFEVDLAHALCKRMGAECEIVGQAWEGIIPALQAKKYDAIMAGMSITAKRKEVINFSKAYFQTPAILVVLKKGPHAGFKTKLDTLNLEEVSADEKAVIEAMKTQFKGKSIGVQVSTTHENFLKEYLKDVVTIRTYDTQENLDLDLQAGRVDAALASKSYWVPLFAKGKGNDMAMVGPSMTGGPFGAGVGIGLRKSDNELLAAFDKAIEAMKKDGSLQKLGMQWFGFDGVPE